MNVTPLKSRAAASTPMLSRYGASFKNSGAAIIFSIFLIIGFNTKARNKPPVKAVAWVGTWATSPQLVEPNNMPPAPGLTNNTLRQVVAVSVGGKKLRLKFSNEFSKSPVVIRSVQIAVSKGGSAIDAATSKTLQFNGVSGITLNPGDDAASDELAFNLQPRMQVAITIAFGETSATLTGHPGSRTTSYLLAGDHNTPDADFSAAATTDHWYVMDGIDVEVSKSAAAAVGIIGDSITDGRGSGTNKQNRWPDILSLNLLDNRKTKNIGVLNMGIGGNCVLKGGLGPTALNRFDHDILKQQGVKWLIIFEGVNDLGSTRDSAAAFTVAHSLIDAYQNMISQAHARSLKVYGVTITPFKSSQYYQPYRDKARNFINDWIRTAGHFDACIDFDKTIRDPGDAALILNAAQSDHLHPNELGYKMMGESIDFSLFK